VFCLACPFQLPRQLGRWLWPARLRWPRALRNKWLAIGLIVVFFWSYEAFSLWNSPWWTAWITLGYFGSALAIDGLFQGASFCKYVCPIGQFHFVQSLTSPLEVAARDPAVCASCTTRDCIRGTPPGATPPHPNPSPPVGEGQRRGGCELELFVPRKAGNLDCTLCLDCIHACPHDNIGIVATAPGSALWHDRTRSGLGRLSRRPDLAALAAVLVFAAFANAAGMTAPVVQWQDRWTAALGLASPRLVITLFYACTLLVLPAAVIGLAAWLSRSWSGDPASLRELACRYVYALVPIGSAMWLTHYSFHLLTSAGTALAATQRFFLDLGLPFLGQPEWSSCCAAPPADWLIRLEIVFLDLGLLLSLYTSYRIALDRHPRLADALKALAPWMAVILALFVVGVWIVLQPMEMRGTW
jgi:Fe-S-cluster-containing hydrogenase component 2